MTEPASSRQPWRASKGVRSILALLSLLLIAAGCGGQEPPVQENATETSELLGTVTIYASGGERVEVSVEIPDTEAEMQRGLMGRTALAEDAGMLFVVNEEQQLSFWMKDTPLPLSIAYISEEGRIVDIQDMQAMDETLHPSARPAKAALEVNQGFFEEHGVQVGDRVELSER